MSVETVEAVFLAVTCVIPGFIVHSISSLFTTRRPLDFEAGALKFLAFSAVNYGVWSWLIYLILTLELFEYDPIAAAFAWFWVIIVGPVALGILYAVSTKKEWGGKILLWIGLKPVHIIPSAWDWQFGRAESHTGILVTLTDGTQVAGEFSTESFASSDPSERDIYIEAVYEMDGNSPWQLAKPKRGMLIKGDQIRYVEIFQPEESAE